MKIRDLLSIAVGVGAGLFVWRTVIRPTGMIAGYKSAF